MSSTEELRRNINDLRRDMKSCRKRITLGIGVQNDYDAYRRAADRHNALVREHNGLVLAHRKQRQEAKQAAANREAEQKRRSSLCMSCFQIPAANGACSC